VPKLRLFHLVWLAFLPAVLAADTPVSRERISFNADWRFIHGDSPEVGDALTYERIKDWVLPTGDHLLNFRPVPRPRPSGAPGEHLKHGPDYSRAEFNDSAWRALNLPHDWGIEGPFQPEFPNDTAKLPWAGTAWYRNKFALPATDAGRQIYLEIDGAMSYALVWCNGQFVGGWPYGYSSWRVDLTPYPRPGTDNTLAIRLDNPRESSRWYPGGGMYRNVWLLKTAPVAVAQWGVYVTTPVVSRESATVDIGVTLDNSTAAAADARVAVRVFAADAEGHATGEPVAVGAPQPVRISAGRSVHASHTLDVAAPKLWSLKERNRYVAETIVTQGEREVDCVFTPFGIRTVAHTASDGLLLNGERVPLNGVCNHHDLGALGTAVNFRALERQLEILQAMGCNAIRTSHNPPAPELLELCDRLGFLVMVEAFDGWKMGDHRDDYGRVFDDWHEKDLTALIRRDRNHPSVIQWSIGNEVREQSESDGWKLAAHLAAIVRGEDRTRPVVAGLNIVQSAYNGFQTVVDVVAYNYKPAEYANVRARHPHLPVMGSETASTISSRGEYFFPVSEDQAQGRTDFQVSSYDLYAPRWAHPPDVEWKGLDGNPFVLGEFVWTGFDYLGEPTPYKDDSPHLPNFSNPADQARARKELAELGKVRVPSRSSYFGIVDLAGFPKDRYYLYQARWRPDLPMAHILPHWNWPERVGEVTPVHVYSSGDEAELFLNGKSLGRRKRDRFEYRFRWDDVVYAPGELKVVTYKGGKPWAEAVQRTTGPAAKLALAADRASVRADGSDLSFVTVTVADRDGQLVPRAKNRVTFEISGPGEIIATDNGDATSFESFQSKERNAYNGLALVVVRTKAGEPGSIMLRAKSDGLTAAETVIISQPSKPKA
jgi:beta-galactosidase